ncbi:MAG: hypothetical protein VYC34_11755, partial [Planctomycetota bacterium]|nr:hypothetical protein [Planctomycetota bacterium]
ETLKTIAWRRADLPQVRLAAIELLARQDEPDTVNMLALMLPTEPNWVVIDGVCILAAENNWTALTPGLVRSWSRPVVTPPDDERPERKALIALHPDQPVIDVVYDVFRTPASGGLFDERARRDAWTLLTRIDRDGVRTRDLLAADNPPSDDPLLSRLHEAAKRFAVVPRTTPQLEWLDRLGAPEYAAYRDRLATLIAQLSDEQRLGFEIRHFAALVWASEAAPDLLRTSRPELFSALTSDLASVRRTRRTEGYPDRMVAPRETLDEYESDLVWADLVTIQAARAAIQNPDVLSEIFSAVNADRRDTQTEYGGIIDRAAGAFSATLYDPRPPPRRGAYQSNPPNAMRT